MEFNLGSFLVGLLQLCGSLGFFLFGMQLMSEALQKVAGNKMRSILAMVTKNKFVGILTGVLITAVIQSSSATTVMVVSFVNAGLLNLVQAFSVIMGANIGTTATAWIVSLLGFSFSIVDLAIPLVAFSLPLLFSKKTSHKYWGEFLVGFAILFLGLEFLKNSVPDVKAHPEALAFLQNWANMDYWSILIFAIVGAVLTIIVQSSSATVAITLVMCAQGWIDLHVACAMVLGENIGTTITANLAAMNANLSAKRAALSHTFFNLFGVVWCLAVFYPFFDFVSGIVESWTSDPVSQTTWTVSLFHSMFNICNVLVLVWFSKYIVALVEKCLQPRKKKNAPTEDEEEVFHLAYISTGLLSTAELSLLQTRKELHVFGDKVAHMYSRLTALIDEKNPQEFNAKFDRMKKREEISDQIEREIAKYITQVSTGQLSDESKLETQQILRITSEIESIADGCFKVACIAKNNRDKQISLSETDRIKLQDLINLVGKSIDGMLVDIESDTLTPEAIAQAKTLEIEINNLRTRLLAESTKAITEGEEAYGDGAYFRDLVRVLERIGDYVVNVIEARMDHKLFKDA